MKVNVRSIGESCYENCTSLASISIPATCTSIGIGAFKGCTSLATATFGTTSGWSANGVSLDVSNTSTAATYLKSTYVDYAFSR